MNLISIKKIIYDNKRFFYINLILDHSFIFSLISYIYIILLYLEWERI